MTLLVRDLARRDVNVPRLTAAGLSQQAAEDKATLFARAAQTLQAAGVDAATPVIACYVPGRIEVLGKHTDYAGGRSLLAVPERGFCMAAVARNDSSIRMTSVADGQQACFDFSAAIVPAAGDWPNYPMTVARRLARNFPGDLIGAEIAFASDLPVAAGMSSSSALVVATYLVLATANAIDRRAEFRRHIQGREDLAAYLGTIENGQTFGGLAGDLGVGTFGGSEDHTAMLCAARGVLKQYAYCPVRWERSIELPSDHTFVIASSGMVAEKTGAAMERYNRVSRLASAAVEVWRQATGRDDPHLAAALTSSPDAADRIREVLRTRAHPEFDRHELVDRFEQFVVENEQLIPAVPDRLTSAALNDFRDLVQQSQERGARLLQNQLPETVYLAETAGQFGAVAASAFGAGFGGSVWALVPWNQATELLRRWSESYLQQFPSAAVRAAFFATPAGPAAFVLNPD